MADLVTSGFVLGVYLFLNSQIYFILTSTNILHEIKKKKSEKCS